MDFVYKNCCHISMHFRTTRSGNILNLKPFFVLFEFICKFCNLVVVWYTLFDYVPEIIIVIDLKCFATKCDRYF